MATVWGTRSIRGNVTIQAGVNDTLSFNVDGINHYVTLNAGTYKTVRELHTSEFVKALNDAVIAKGIPMNVKLGGALNNDGKVNYVVFEHQNASGTIDTFSGTMMSLIFK